MRLFSFLLVFVVFVSVGQENVQVKYSFLNYGVNEGLPSSEVYDIHQDPDRGVIYFATDRGLSIFDGYSFTNYTIEDGLNDNVIIKLLPDNYGNIWCSTLNGNLCYIDTQKKIRSYKYNKQLQDFISKSNKVELAQIKIHSLINNSNNSLRLSSQQLMGEILIDEKGNVSWKYNSDIKFTSDVKFYLNFIPADSYYYYSLKMIEKHSYECNDFDYGKGSHIKDSMYLYTQDSSISVYNGKALLYSLKTKERVLLSGKVNEAVYWVSFITGGVYFYDVSGNVLFNFFDKETITDVIQDHEGGYWFSTLSNGVFYLKTPLLKTIPFSNRINSITALDSSIVIGFYDGTVGVLNTKKLEYKEMSEFKGVRQAFVQADTVNKQVYVSNLLKIGCIDSSFNCIYVLRGGGTKISDDMTEKGIYFASYSGYGVLSDKKYSIQPSPFRTTDVSFINNKIMLAGYNGIYEYNSETRKSTQIMYPELKFRVDDIDKFRDGLLCTTLGGGCVYYDEDTLFPITKKNGLFTNMCTQVFVQNNSVVWLATTAGINKIVFDKNMNYDISGFTITDGLPSNEVIDMDMVNDNMWIATKYGLSCIKHNFNPDYTISNYFLSIEKILVDGLEVTKNSKSIELPFDKNNIEFYFRAISFSRNSSLTYRYMLSPINLNWNYTSGRSVLLATLEPGNYELILQASADNINWSMPQMIKFEVNSPFWKRWWFILAINALFVGAAYLLFRYRINLQKQKINIIESEMKALRAQMNPHFVFNSLASIQNFILKGNIADSNKYLVKFSKLIRGVLENSKTELIAIEYDLDMLKLYIELEKLRVNPFEYDIIIDSTIDIRTIKIPPLLIQPFVENAIWHGFKSLDRTGIITIELKIISDKLVCVVEDNGVGRNFLHHKNDMHTTNYKSHGIEITTQRIKSLGKIHNTTTGILIIDKKDNLGNANGTRIEITLPIIKII